VEKRGKIPLSILIVDETRRAVVPALDEVEGVAGKYEAQRTGHAAIDAAKWLIWRHRIPAGRMSPQRLCLL